MTNDLNLRLPAIAIERINEVFHDLEARFYEQRHGEIAEGRTENWNTIFSRSVDRLQGPVRILDFGIGTGLVTLFACERLGMKRVARVVGVDISASMLRLASEKLAFLGDRFTPIKVEAGEQPPLESASCDLIIINSVLHHLPDPMSTIRYLATALKPGGIFLVVHEPNIRYVQNRLIHGLFRLARGLRHAIVRQRDVQLESITQGANTILLQEKVIDHPLTAAELQAIVDYQVPDVFGIRKSGIGIDPYLLAEECADLFTPLLVTTYRYFSLGLSTWWGIVDLPFRLLFPRAGRLFTISWQKK